MDPMMEALLAKPTRRMMIFIDGENLVLRYQNSLKQGRVPNDGTFHIKDVAVWRTEFSNPAQWHEILRVTYYTSAVGDEKRVAQVEDEIRRLKFFKHRASLLPDTVTPCVFKKTSKTRSGKGVDIKLCVDVLTHVYRGTTDAILLMSGDGDYEPLITEVLRNGVQVYLSAYTDGLSPRLRNIADSFWSLDGPTWKPSNNG